METGYDPSPESPLRLFHTKDDGDPRKDFWTSQMARNWTKLNYQYNDLEPGKGAIDEKGELNENKKIYKMDLLAHIQKIYPSTKNYVHGIRRDGKAKNKQFFEEDKDFWDDYIINVVYDRYALNGLSYTIEFDLEGRLVGQVYAFTDRLKWLY
ncbi:putative tyrosinase [Seiridium cardinale]